jgi:hypothetical protein
MSYFIDDVLLGLGTVRTGWWKPTYWKSVLSPSSGPTYIILLIPSMVTSALKMETARFSETLASTSHSTRRPNPEQNQYHHCHENLKCLILLTTTTTSTTLPKARINVVIKYGEFRTRGN